MGDHCFEALTRSVTRDQSRRGTLRLLAAGALGGLRTSLGVPRAEAAHFGCRHVGKHCHGSTQCCSGICKRHQCRAHDKGICTASQDTCAAEPFPCGATCYCYITTGKAPFCGGNSTDVDCTLDEECENTWGAGAACIACADSTACVAACPNPD